MHCADPKLITHRMLLQAATSGRKRTDDDEFYYGDAVDEQDGSNPGSEVSKHSEPLSQHTSRGLSRSLEDTAGKRHRQNRTG